MSYRRPKRVNREAELKALSAVSSMRLLCHVEPMKTFKCNFGKGVSCEIQVTDVAPPKGSQHVQKIEWTGKPSPKVIRPYIAWMNSVNKTLADEWGVKLMHVFQTTPQWKDWEIWIYEPNKPPKRQVA